MTALTLLDYVAIAVVTSLVQASALAVVYLYLKRKIKNSNIAGMMGM